MDKMDDNEWISALADGQLQGDEFARAVKAACADRATLATWHAYHVIGDVIRSGDVARTGAAQPFLDKLSARLAQEPRPQPVVVPMMAVQQGWSSKVAANDSSMRWKLLAGVASVAAVAAVGWSVVGAGGASAVQPQFAAAPQQPAAPVLARSEAGLMIRDARLDELLAAHRQFGGASALQMPAGFVRNATFEGPSR